MDSTLDSGQLQREFYYTWQNMTFLREKEWCYIYGFFQYIGGQDTFG